MADNIDGVRVLRRWGMRINGRVRGKKSVQIGRGVGRLHPQSQAYIDLIYFKVKAHIGEEITRPVFVRIKAYFKAPKSWSKKKRERAIAGRLVPASRATPDGDNIEKCVFDGLDGGAKRTGALADDALIFDHRTTKYYAGSDYIVIQICELDIEGG